MGNTSSSESNEAQDLLFCLTGTNGSREDDPWCCSIASRNEGRRSTELSDVKRKKAASLWLHRAAAHGILHEIEPNVKLWTHSSDMIDSADPNGDTALHKAAKFGHLEICKVLCKVMPFTFTK
jgi:hypothetical protein